MRKYKFYNLLDYFIKYVSTNNICTLLQRFSTFILKHYLESLFYDYKKQLNSSLITKMKNKKMLLFTRSYFFCSFRTTSTFKKIL